MKQNLYKTPIVYNGIGSSWMGHIFLTFASNGDHLLMSVLLVLVGQSLSESLIRKGNEKLQWQNVIKRMKVSWINDALAYFNATIVLWQLSCINLYSSFICMIVWYLSLYILKKIFTF